MAVGSNVLSYEAVPNWPDVPSDVVQAAEAQGWRVVIDKAEPAGGFDLVVGDASHPRRLIVDDGMPASDLEFRLARRLNVVMRRRFWRGMKRLFK